MLFFTTPFLIFFVIVFVLYWSISSNTFRVYLLLLSSYAFYAAWNHWLALLVVLTSSIDFYLALKIEQTPSPTHKKRLMQLSVLMNIALLCYFKYKNFFIASLVDLLQSLGVQVHQPTLGFISVLGISYYTFEAINYTVDVYRGKLRAERSLPHFLVFILFFPHLIAGPIVKAREFLPQIRKPKRWGWPRCVLGIGLFSLGLFMKLAIADRMALITDPVFAEPAKYDSFANWQAAMGFAIQVFCDFSGYTNMALGTAHLLGFKLTPNFAMPFLARNIAEFWRRWHMSLSSWLRDYVFIPLGGSRAGFWHTCRNLILTMTLGGLWHGANWNMVLWGTLMGVILSVRMRFALWVSRKPLLNKFIHKPVLTPFCVALTLFTFVLSLVVFRAPSLMASGQMLVRMFIPTEGLACPAPPQAIASSLVFLVIGHIMGVRIRRNRFAWRRVHVLFSPVFIGFLGAVLIILAVVLSPGNSRAFVYFDF
jgi:alginate O-acetyltransferase complex protein AlgI